MDAYRLKSEAIQTKPAYAGFKSQRRLTTLREGFAYVFVAALFIAGRDSVLFQSPSIFARGLINELSSS